MFFIVFHEKEDYSSHFLSKVAASQIICFHTHVKFELCVSKEMLIYDL